MFLQQRGGGKKSSCLVKMEGLCALKSFVAADSSLWLLQICAVCLEEFKPKDELGICPCKHAFHRK